MNHKVMSAIKRLLKLIFFIPVCLISIVYLPFAMPIQWVITGSFPIPPIQYLMDW